MASSNGCLLDPSSLRVVIACNEEDAAAYPDLAWVDLRKRSSFSRFSLAELRGIYQQATGYEYTGHDYGALLQAAHFAVVKVINAQR